MSQSPTDWDAPLEDHGEQSSLLGETASTLRAALCLIAVSDRRAGRGTP